MFTDTVFARRVMNGFNYYINDIRVTRLQFHLHCAEQEMTDFREGDSEYPCPVPRERVFIGHWKSFVNDCTAEAMRLFDIQDPHYDDGFARCLSLTLMDKYWTIEQHNYVYHRHEERQYMRMHCPDCPNTEICRKDLADVRVCIEDDAVRQAIDSYGLWIRRQMENEVD